MLMGHTVSDSFRPGHVLFLPLSLARTQTIRLAEVNNGIDASPAIMTIVLHSAVTERVFRVIL